jgi:hypothetical protein
VEDRIDNPTKQRLQGLPGAVALEQLLDRDGLLADVGVAGIEGPEDGVDRLKEDAAHAILTAGATLNQAQVVVDVNIDVLEGLAAGALREVARLRRRERGDRCVQGVKNGLREERRSGFDGRRGRGCCLIEAMWRRLVVGGQGSVGKVGASLGGSGKPGRTLNPAHRAGQREGN